jgi:quercetin dioxygenase-like cupin family protein
MTLAVRRVVTGHDSEGRAIVKIDEIKTSPPQAIGGADFVTVWSSAGFPVDNAGEADEANSVTGITRPGGTHFTIVQVHPGNQPVPHRTSTVDYAVIMSGEIDMELEEGTTVHLKTGDVLVQRGTWHNWLNKGNEPCVIAFALIDAQAVTAGGKTLEATFA